MASWVTVSGIDERTLLLIKPDGVVRGLCGEIIGRLERAGLAIIGLKMVRVSRERAEAHYADDPVWLTALGSKTLRTYTKHERDPIVEMGTADALTIGRIIRGWLIDYMISAPIVACVVQGPHVIDVVRKLAGDTMPSDAAAGSIRGDFATVSAVAANSLQIAVRNIVHASSSADEAEREIETWFHADELCPHRPLAWTAIYNL